jgi:TetR/AcrR family transcriptional repressor of nem operon
MARPKSFDEDTVLDAATTCFRRQGLNAASVRDLAEEMGIAGPSLYNAFGCKRALFIQALERYVNCGMRVRFAEWERRGPKAAILAFIANFIEQALGGSEHGRCLLINTAMEVDHRDAELAALVAGYLGEIEAFLRRNLSAARMAGEIPPERDPEETAGLLLAALLGVSVFARLQPDAARLASMVPPILALFAHDPQNASPHDGEIMPKRKIETRHSNPRP